jgi:hypothetical protein
MGSGQPWWKPPWPSLWFRIGGLGAAVFVAQVSIARLNDREVSPKLVALFAVSDAVAMVGVGVWLSDRNRA